MTNNGDLIERGYEDAKKDAHNASGLTQVQRVDYQRGYDGWLSEKRDSIKNRRDKAKDRRELIQFIVCFGLVMWAFIAGSLA